MRPGFVVLAVSDTNRGNAALHTAWQANDEEAESCAIVCRLSGVTAARIPRPGNGREPIRWDMFDD
jgi:hypothetical protein